MGPTILSYCFVLAAQIISISISVSIMTITILIILVLLVVLILLAHVATEGANLASEDQLPPHTSSVLI